VLDCVPGRAGKLTGVFATSDGSPMIILGLILLILGLIFSIYILWIIGIVLIVVGAILWLLGSMDRAIGGRRHYW
jgi:hypothetical protein